ncbi:hypothetical protein WI73_19535 [Burkholderia ubonensis]|nr:hypothetical protein WI73_19535 [Burkholderia ubonensis]
MSVKVSLYEHAPSVMLTPQSGVSIRQAIRSDLVVCMKIPDDGDTLSGYRRLHEQRIIEAGKVDLVWPTCRGLQQSKSLIHLRARFPRQFAWR